MIISGGGAGINELTALAVTSELAPTAKRGKYVAILIFTIGALHSWRLLGTTRSLALPICMALARALV